MAAADNGTEQTDRSMSLVVRRHALVTRLTHWLWALALFFLLLSGLQIFNAHPALYVGQQSGFAFDNSVLSINATRTADGDVRGVTTFFGHGFDTTGMLGVSGPVDRRAYRAFPSWLTVPSYQDLATGRVVHFFFAWVFATVFVAWIIASIINGHLRRDIVPSGEDLRGLPRSVLRHLRFQFDHGRRYNGLQKLSYAIVLLIFFPLMILTGMSMSPGMNAAWPWLLDVFGGRQTARTIHFVIMLLLVLFFVVHIFMVFAAGPINELRSMISGRYRIDSEPHQQEAGR